MEAGAACPAGGRRIEKCDQADEKNEDHGNEQDFDHGQIDQGWFADHGALFNPYDSGAGRVKDQQAESGGDGEDERQLDEEVQDALKAGFAGHDSLTARSARR